MQVLILAAGKGERMRPLTLVKPKPLLEVFGTSLIEHHIINLQQAGFKDIVINISWLAQQIMTKLGNGSQYGVKIRYSFEGDEPLETGGGMLKALALLEEEPFLVVNGDIFTDFEFSRIQYSADILAHLVLVNNPEHNPKGDFTLLQNKRLSTQTSEQASEPASKQKLTYSGIGIYHPKLLQDAKPGKFSIVPFLKRAMDKNLVTGQHHKGNWDDIGTIQRLTQINIKPKSR